MRKNPIFSTKFNRMKKIHWSLIFSVALTAVICISCDPDEPQAPTRAELMASGAWKFQSATYGGVDVSTAPQLACFVDNTITFSTSSTYTVSEGTVICSPSTAGSGTWSFKDADSLQLSSALVPGGAGTFKINTLTATSLVLQQNATIPPSPTQPFVVTFRH
jgi:hypothetical protein